MDISDCRVSEVSVREKCIVTATVGRDTIEAEYWTFGHSDFVPSEFNKLTKIWNAIVTAYYVVRRNVLRVYWNCRYGFQRMFKGYDSVDTFETYARFVERYSKILKELRDSHMGYPCDITEKEWDNILDDMLYHLHYMEEDNVVADLEKSAPEGYYASQKSIDEIMAKHKDEFFELFSEYFYNLWD